VVEEFLPGYVQVEVKFSVAGDRVLFSLKIALTKEVAERNKIYN
jgi:hypothetical protein